MENDLIVSAFEYLLEIKIGDVKHLIVSSTLKSILRKIDLNFFSMTDITDLKEFLESLLNYCQQNGLRYELTSYEQKTLLREAETLKFSNGNWHKAFNLKNFFVIVLTLIYLFNLQVQEEVIFDNEIHQKMEKKLIQLRPLYDIEKRLKVKEKIFERFKKVKEFEFKSLKTELKESSEKLDKLRRDTKEKERVIMNLKNQQKKLVQENKNLTEVLFTREEGRIKDKEALQCVMKKSAEKDMQLKQIMNQYKMLQKKNSHLEVVLNRGKKRDHENQKLRLKVMEMQEKITKITTELGRQKQIKETENQQLNLEKTKIENKCKAYKLQVLDLDLKFEKLKSGMDYYRNSYRNLLSQRIQQKTKKDYDSQPTSNINNQFFEENENDNVNLYSSAIPIDHNDDQPALNFSFENLITEKKQEKNLFKKNDDHNDDEIIFEQDNENDKEDKNSEKQEEIKEKKTSMNLKNISELEPVDNEEDMNWGIEKEGEFLNLSGSFDMNHQSFNQKLEDIMEESNESECQSGYSSSRKVIK